MCEETKKRYIQTKNNNKTVVISFFSYSNTEYKRPYSRK